MIRGTCRRHPAEHSSIYPVWLGRVSVLLGLTGRISVRTCLLAGRLESTPPAPIPPMQEPDCLPCPPLRLWAARCRVSMPAGAGYPPSVGVVKMAPLSLTARLPPSQLSDPLGYNLTVCEGTSCRIFGVRAPMFQLLPALGLALPWEWTGLLQCWRTCACASAT
jgi:hypothetical protein